MTTGFVTHAASLLHDPTPGHPERPDRVTRIERHLEDTGLKGMLQAHEPEAATDEIVGLAHPHGYMDELRDLDAAGGGRIDADTSMGSHSLEATLRATQGAVDSVARVLDGRWTNAFVCMRPPGHHATTLTPMGFCLTNHAAVAGRWAVEQGGARRVAIVDWDAHHGNGTQDIFWSDPFVLYASLHQYPWYPGSGDVSERGGGVGAGSTINVPLPAGSAEDAYTRAFDEIIEPAVATFAPDLVIVSAGFDAHHADPLCMMRLSAGAFFRAARRIASWGPGPVCVLEGGYDLDALAWSAAATVSALVGAEEAMGVPPHEVDALPGHPDADRWVDRALAVHRA